MTTRTAFNDRDQATTTTTGLDLNHDGAIDSGASVTTTQMFYDANGSTTRETTGGVTKRYVWDLRNRLIGFDAEGDGDTLDAGDATFGYDHAGVRAARRERPACVPVQRRDEREPRDWHLPNAVSTT